MAFIIVQYFIKKKLFMLFLLLLFFVFCFTNFLRPDT